MPHPSRRASAAILAAALLAASAGAADLSTLSGKKYKGDLVSVDAEVLTFRTDVGAVGVPVKDVFAVEFGHKVEVPAAGAKYDEIELTDGSVVRCTQFKIRKKAVEPALLPARGDVPAPKVAVPMDNLFAILRGADDPKNRDEWKKLLGARGKRDQFVVKRGEGFEPVAGTVVEGDEGGDAITFERETGERTTYKLARATGGLVFNPPPRGAIPPTVCKVIDVFGNVLTAQAVELAGPGLTVRTVSGATFEYPALAGVAKLDFSQGNILYLSDLKPDVSPPAAGAGPPFPYRVNETDDKNAPLRLDGVAYAKGLWVRADTTLAYKLTGEYREFKALVGMDESVNEPSYSVKLVIAADGKVVFSEVIARKDKARPVTLDVKGAKQLTISVERTHPLDGVSVDLAEARLQK